MTARLTTDEMNTWLVQDGRGIVMISEYTNANTRSLFRCNLGHEWWANPGNIRRGKGCPSCAITAPSSLEFNEWLSENNNTISLVGEYVNRITKVEFACTQGHTWLASPSSIKNGSGCPHCAGKHKPSTSEFREWLLADGRGISIVNEYTNNYTKTLFRCSSGHEWLALPNSIKNGTGCPYCAEYGFSPNKPAWGYVLKFSNFIKYGITNDLDRRLIEHLRNGQYTLVYSYCYENGHQALDWENRVKQTYGGRYVTKEQCPDGWTETLPESLLESLLPSKNE